MSDDFPTFERQINAYSGMVCCGHCITSGEDITKEAVIVTAKLQQNLHLCKHFYHNFTPKYEHSPHKTYKFPFVY